MLLQTRHLVSVKFNIRTASSIYDATIVHQLVSKPVHELILSNLLLNEVVYVLVEDVGEGFLIELQILRELLVAELDVVLDQLIYNSIDGLRGRR